jgi:hypothetical protein
VRSRAAFVQICDPSVMRQHVADATFLAKAKVVDALPNGAHSKPIRSLPLTSRDMAAARAAARERAGITSVLVVPAVP